MNNIIKEKPRAIIDRIVRTSVTKIVHAAGFTQKGRSYFRRNGSVVQVINIQLSRLNQGDEGYFFVNI